MPLSRTEKYALEEMAAYLSDRDESLKRALIRTRDAIERGTPIRGEELGWLMVELHRARRTGKPLWESTARLRAREYEYYQVRIDVTPPEKWIAAYKAGQIPAAVVIDVLLFEMEALRQQIDALQGPAPPSGELRVVG
ncbi:MAG: hypothetical protein M5U01_09420 [Ardenticatenaceae bacterium]|nr:hypothetical protein [Ardenticatenaceae bacterium]